VDQDALEISNISVHIAPIWPQIHDWVADDLTRTMVCDVATATGLVHLDTARGEQLRRCNQVRPRDLRPGSECDDVWVFEEKKEIRNAAGAPLLDERTLHLICRCVPDDAEPPDF
jgi:hypothetical protein